MTKKLNPVYRLCYISNLTESGNLIIKEHNDSRGAKFSSLYKLLYTRIKDSSKNCFKMYPDSIAVCEKNISIFIDIVNDILEGLNRQEYDLYKDDSIYKINFTRDNQTYWYNKVYWMPKNIIVTNNLEEVNVGKIDNTQEVLISDEEAIIAFESLIKTQNIGLNTARKKRLLMILKRCLPQ